MGVGVKEHEVLFQVCLLLRVKPWEKPSCIMQLHVTERWGLGQHGYRTYYPVMPEFIKAEHLMHENLYGAVFES